MAKYRLIMFFLVFFVGADCKHNNATGQDREEKQPETTEFTNETQGGLGGRIIKVTNLNAEGTGSLRAAIETNGPRIVVFEVGGVIDLNMQKISIRSPFITIAGQTAPHPGITIIKGGVNISTHDVIIKDICIRPGDAGQPKKSGWEPDGMTTIGERAHHILIDHCSLTWAVDENLSTSGPRLEGPEHTSHNVTFSNNIIAEGLSVASHSKGEHSKGSLIHDNCQGIAIIGNLYADNVDRNPFCKAATQGVIANNLIYNPVNEAIEIRYSEKEWASSQVRPTNGQWSIVGNVFYYGSQTKNIAMVQHGGDVYMEDNQAYDRNMGKVRLKDDLVVLVNQKPAWLKGFKPIPAGEVVNSVIKNAGARPKDRDPIDQRIVRDFIDKKGKIINSQNEVGGYPDYKATYRRLDVPATNIKEWLAQMAQEVE